LFGFGPGIDRHENTEDAVARVEAAIQTPGLAALASQDFTFECTILSSGIGFGT
jgi:hypothetical protein